MISFASRRVVSAVLLVACATWSGCNSADSYAVKVDAITKKDVPTTGTTEGQSFKIKSKNPAVGEENLRYREAAEYVKTALSGRGLYEAPNAEKADVIVELDYGIDAPRSKMETVTVPRYAQVGGGVRYEPVAVKDSSGNTSYRTVAVYQPPRTELVTYDEVPQMVTVYEKYLRITARENKPAAEGRPPAELWSVSTSTEDQSKDIRKYLPIMASATADYIGRDSNKEKVVRVKSDSPTVEQLRRGMGEPDSILSQKAAPVPPKI